MSKITEHFVRSWITSLLGIAIMALAGYYFYININTLTTENILIGLLLGAVGFIFLFVKDSLITGFFKKNTNKP